MLITFSLSSDEAGNNFSYQIFGTDISCGKGINVTMPSLTSYHYHWMNTAPDHVLEMEQVNYIRCMKLTIIHPNSNSVGSIQLNLKIHQCSMWDSVFFRLMRSFSSNSIPCLNVSPRKIRKIPFTEEACLRRRFAYSIGTYFSDEVQCQCDIYCHEFDDCCLNVDEKAPEYFEYPDLLDMISHQLDLKEKNENVRGITGCVSNQIPSWERTHCLGYFMVIDCPHGESHSLVRDHCTQSVSREELTLFHFIPVEVKYIVYRNVFCALCHGIAVLHESSLWATKFDDSEGCKNLIEKMKKFENVPFLQLERECLASSFGFFGPPSKTTGEELNVFAGQTRMGKVCIIPDGVPLVEEVPIAVMMSESRSPHSMQYRECKRAMLTDMKSENEGFNILFSLGGGVLTKTNHICSACSNSVFKYLFSNSILTSEIYTILVPKFHSFTIDGRIAVLFSQGEILDCSTFGVCEKKAQIGHYVQVALSQAGCFFSFASLCTSIQIFKSRGDFCSSEPKRIQFLLILSKLAFFSTFAVGHYFRALYSVCKTVAVILHYTVLVSFSTSILFGAKVMTMLLRIKYDIAALAIENRNDQKTGWREVAQYIGIWGSILVVVIFFGVYEFALDNDIFGYGDNEICFVTKQKALLYTLVVPTSVTVGANILTTIISACLMFSISKNHPRNTYLAQSIINFLGRLLAFQSVQWVVGLGCYFSSNQVVGFLFSFLTAFEGVFIYIGVLTSKG